MNDIICFTDGACINNGKNYAKASYAVVYPYCQEHNYSDLLESNEKNTNNRAELYAILYAIEKFCSSQNQKKLIIYSDSQYSINCITKWMKKWKLNNWKTNNKTDVLNKDILEKIDSLLNENIFFRFVKAHQKDDSFETKYNNMVDKLARNKLFDNNVISNVESVDISVKKTITDYFK